MSRTFFFFFLSTADVFSAPVITMSNMLNEKSDTSGVGTYIIPFAIGDQNWGILSKKKKKNTIIVATLRFL